MFLKCNIAIHCEQARNDQLEILYIPYKFHFDWTNLKKIKFFIQNRQGPLLKKANRYFNLKTQMRIKNKKKGFTNFFFVQLAKCPFKTFQKEKFTKIFTF